MHTRLPSEDNCRDWAQEYNPYVELTDEIEMGIVLVYELSEECSSFDQESSGIDALINVILNNRAY